MIQKSELIKNLKRSFIAIVIFSLVFFIPGEMEVIAEDVNDTTIDAEYIAYIEEISDMYGVCPELIEAIIESESGGNPNVKSSAGAIGLMQVIPKWNEDRIERLGVTDLYDPYQNILVGTDLIMELADEYYDLPVVLTAYNTGQYSKSTKRAIESGNGNKYAEKIVNRTRELEFIHGK